MKSLNVKIPFNIDDLFKNSDVPQFSKGASAN